MSHGKLLLKKKANGIVQSIEKMTPDERQMLPTHLFGEDYNKLRSMVIDADNNLEAYMPPEVTFESYGIGDTMLSIQRYAEIHAFCRQILEFLSE